MNRVEESLHGLLKSSERNDRALVQRTAMERPGEADDAPRVGRHPRVDVKSGVEHPLKQSRALRTNFLFPIPGVGNGENTPVFISIEHVKSLAS